MEKNQANSCPIEKGDISLHRQTSRSLVDPAEQRILLTTHCGGHFLLPNTANNTAALSKDICSTGYDILMFDDGITAAVSLPIMSNIKTMKTVSLTPRVARKGLAWALAKKASEFLTSQSLSIALALIALVALVAYLATGNHATMAAVLICTFGIQLCSSLMVDIKQKGGEL